MPRSLLLGPGELVLSPENKINASIGLSSDHYIYYIWITNRLIELATWPHF
jgi:hypothetical protein